MADDWGWPHAGAYGDPVVETPTFDRLAEEGILFENAFVAVPSCTACRNTLLTGQKFFRLGQGANLWSTLHPKHAVFPLMLEESGYAIGHWRKAWGPGNYRALGRDRDPTGPAFRNFPDFLKKKPEGKPFCFWLGTSDPHRPYQSHSGAESGIDIDRIQLPADLPDAPIVRHDVADYYYEVQRWDGDVGKALELLEEKDLLENTLVVMTGDHGMPFPRHKCHLYDSGTHVPLAMRWGANIAPGRRVTDFVCFDDLAPTFLEVAGVPIPEAMTGNSLKEILYSEKSGRIDPDRDHVITGRERHGTAQEAPETGGYPSRALRTENYLYIHNFKPTRWPAGAPADSTNGSVFGDCDGSPTKRFLIEHAEDPEVAPYFELAFAKRPAEELYDLREDPHQLRNMAAHPENDPIKEKLRDQLFEALRQMEDPRLLGEGDAFDDYPYRRNR
jgi:arylsulfatase A-like enzyme